MDSLLWFFIIIGVIVGIVIALIGLGVVWLFLTEGGGCFILIGVILILIGIALVTNVGGPAGGFGILLALLGVGAGWMGIQIFRDAWK